VTWKLVVVDFGWMCVSTVKIDLSKHFVELSCADRDY